METKVRMSCRLGTMVALVLVGVVLAAILQEATVDAASSSSDSPAAKSGTGYLDYGNLKAKLPPLGVAVTKRPCIAKEKCRG